MSKRTVFTTITPLPAGVNRQTAIEFLQNHLEMIDLNPLVQERHPIKPPAHATPEEFHCVWYSLTDKISYLPGGLATGDVSYTCAFHDLPNGLQTHCYAPMGLDIRDKWTVQGSLPGEPVQPVELGIGAPLTGLYIREDIDMRCNFVMTGFVKKTLKKAHATLVARLKVKAQISEAASINASLASGINNQHLSAAGSHQSWVLPPMPGSPDPRHGMPLGSPGFAGFPPPRPSPGSPHGSEFAIPAAPGGGGGPSSGGSPGYPPYAHPSTSSSPDPTLRHSATAGRDASGRVSWQALRANNSVSSRHSSSTEATDAPLPPLPPQHTGPQQQQAYPQMNPYGPSTTPPPGQQQQPYYPSDMKPLPLNPQGYPQQQQQGYMQQGYHPSMQQHMQQMQMHHMQQQQQQQHQQQQHQQQYQQQPQQPQQHAAELVGTSAATKGSFVAELE